MWRQCLDKRAVSSQVVSWIRDGWAGMSMIMAENILMWICSGEDD